MDSTEPGLLIEVIVAVVVLVGVFGSIVLFSWIGSRFRDRPSKGGPLWFFDHRMGRPPEAEPDLFNEPSMFGKISHGERITDARVTARAPVDPMLTDPIDEKPKDLKS